MAVAVAVEVRIAVTVAIALAVVVTVTETLTNNNTATVVTSIRKSVIIVEYIFIYSMRAHVPHSIAHILFIPENLPQPLLLLLFSAKQF